MQVHIGDIVRCDTKKLFATQRWAVDCSKFTSLEDLRKASHTKKSINIDTNVLFTNNVCEIIAVSNKVNNKDESYVVQYIPLNRLGIIQAYLIVEKLASQ